MVHSRRRSLPLVLTLPWATVAAAACGSSGPTPVTCGPPCPTGHGVEVDSFAYTTTANGTWIIHTGEIAAYLIETLNRVRDRGIVSSPELLAPGPVTPRLLTDTLVLGDTIPGPPSGADLLVPNYLVYDNSANLWISFLGNHGGSVIEYARAQTSQNGPQYPSVTLTGSKAPLGLAFDSAGALWVVDSAATALLKYGATAVVTGGTPNATVSLTGITGAGATWAPIELRIDHAGNFWISSQPRTLPSGTAADSVPAYIVSEFTAAAIQGGGTPTPVLTLVEPGYHPGGYGPGVAFDASGNLWTLNPNLKSLTEFTTSSLTAGSSPAPAITVSASVLQAASDAFFDAAGILYVGGGTNGTAGQGIFAYSPARLAKSGSPAPRFAYQPMTGVNHFAVK